jgi:hypothetical protein
MSVSDVRDSGFSKREVAVSQTDISSATLSGKYHRVLMPRMNLTQSAAWRRMASWGHFMLNSCDASIASFASN